MIDEQNKTIYGVKLRPTQYRLLTYIMNRPNLLTTRNEILENVWGKDTLVKPSVVDVHLSQIKRLVPQIKIINRSGFGFIYVQ